MSDSTFEPRIVAFFCNWCTYTAADLTGISRLDYAHNVRVMCSGRIDPQFIMAALRQGADGVLIGGCHPGDCHYIEGNYKMLRRYRLMRKYLKMVGIEEDRVRLEWIAASEGDKVQRVINEMTESLRAMGPLEMPSMPMPELNGVEADAKELAAVE